MNGDGLVEQGGYAAGEQVTHDGVTHAGTKETSEQSAQELMVGEFPGGSGVKTFLPVLGVGGRGLDGELRSLMTHGQNNKTTTTTTEKNRSNTAASSITLKMIHIKKKTKMNSWRLVS